MWHRLQRREKILLALLGVTLLFFVLLKFLLIPQLNNYSENKENLTSLQANVRVAEAVVKSQAKEEELAHQVAQQLNEIKPLFENIMGDGLAIVHIGLKAAETDVQIVAFIPSEIVDKGTYLELPVYFEARGYYPDVSNFISQIEDLPDLSEIRALQISPYKEKNTEDASGAAATGVSAGQGSGGESEDNPLLHDGIVLAAFDLVTYTSPSPEARLQLEELLSWAVGRYNSFQAPGAVSPYPGINPAVKATKDVNPFVLPFTIDDIFPGVLKELLEPDKTNVEPPSNESVEKTAEKSDVKEPSNIKDDGAGNVATSMIIGAEKVKNNNELELVEPAAFQPPDAGVKTGQPAGSSENNNR